MNFSEMLFSSMILFGFVTQRSSALPLEGSEVHDGHLCELGVDENDHGGDWEELSLEPLSTYPSSKSLEDPEKCSCNDEEEGRGFKGFRTKVSNGIKRFWNTLTEEWIPVPVKFGTQVKDWIRKKLGPESGTDVNALKRSDTSEPLLAEPWMSISGKIKPLITEGNAGISTLTIEPLTTDVNAGIIEPVTTEVNAGIIEPGTTEVNAGIIEPGTTEVNAGIIVPGTAEVNAGQSTLTIEPLLPEANAGVSTLTIEPVIPEVNAELSTLVIDPVVAEVNLEVFEVNPDISDPETCKGPTEPDRSSTNVEAVNAVQDSFKSDNFQEIVSPDANDVNSPDLNDLVVEIEP